MARLCWRVKLRRYAAVAPAAVLAWAGCVKLLQGGDAASFASSLLLVQFPEYLVSMVALVELCVGFAFLLVGPHTILATMAASMYAAFLSVQMYSATLPEPLGPCGCLGSAVNLDLSPYAWAIGSLILLMLSLYASRSLSEHTTPQDL
jgi:hypothetical protein